MSVEGFVIYGDVESGRPLLMCHPSEVERMLSIEDRPEEFTHLVSIVSTDWNDAREVYDAMWRRP